MKQVRDNRSLSVVVRFHDLTRIHLLDHALFSLAAQDYDDLEVTIVYQARRFEDLLEVAPTIAVNFGLDASEIRALPAEEKVCVGPHTITWLHLPAGQDGRSRALNRGIELARGRYLGFLDYDDLMYQGGYRKLIAHLESHECPIVVGGIRVAIVDSKLLDDDLYVKHKRPFTAMKKDVLDLFIENFIPIHSYVLDRNRIDDADLRIREDLTKLEDYEFLLRLCAHHGIDLELAQEPVGEYRIRNDGSNTVEAGCLTPERISEWDLARAEIEQVKKTLTYRSTIYDLAVLGQARMVTRVEAPPPPMISQSIHEVINTPVRLVFYKLGLMLDGQLSRISPLYKVVNGLISGSTILAKRVALRLQRFLRRRR